MEYQGLTKCLHIIIQFKGQIMKNRNQIVKVSSYIQSAGCLVAFINIIIVTVAGTDAISIQNITELLKVSYSLAIGIILLDLGVSGFLMCKYPDYKKMWFIQFKNYSRPFIVTLFVIGVIYYILLRTFYL